MTDLGDHLRDFQEFERLVGEISWLEASFEWSYGEYEEQNKIKLAENRILLEEVRARLHRYLDIEDLIADMKAKEDDEDDDF